MGFWSRVLGIDGITANMNSPAPVPGTVGEPDWNPGDPDGLELQDPDVLVENRSLPFPQASPWSGYAAGWSTPNLSTGRTGISKLIDIAYACTDLNSNVLSAMPVYHTVDGQIDDPVEWMNNPDPSIYSSWLEFAKQLFWDFQMGEAFVLAMTRYADNYPKTFRVVPPWLVNVEMRKATRVYNIGSNDVTDRILHIRYKSTIDDARGHGPLEVAGARMTGIGMLQRYVSNLAETGGVTKEWIGVDRVLRNTQEAKDLLESWIETRTKYAGYPAVLGSGSKLNQAQTMNAKDMALMELSQFNESRIATLLGVPPFLVGLAGASGSLTYSNIADLFDYHDRSSLRPKARMVMEALSEWALPRGHAAELNRDDYTRLPVDKRYTAYKTAIDAGFIFPEEVRAIERLGPIPPGALARQQQQSTTPSNPNAQSTSAAPPTPRTNGKVNTEAAKNLSGGAD